MASRSIVYVDDDPACTNLVGHRLRSRFDYAVETTDNGERALEQLKADDVDCLVLDYRIPGEEPLSLLDEAISSQPDVPVVFFTGIGDPETADAATDAGAAAFVQKGPGGVDALADALDEQLGD